MWRHLPWLTGLALSPFLYGSVTPEGQAVVGFLFAISLFLLALELGSGIGSSTPVFWRWLGLTLLILPLVPLPVALLRWISPERALLAVQFSVDYAALSTWAPLTLSPANTLQRLWEISLLIACFTLARQGAKISAMNRNLPLLLGAAIFLLAASDLWHRLEASLRVLGLWKISWGTGAGTFANRNHFANWLVVAALFSLAWVLRQVLPLRSARAMASCEKMVSWSEVVFLTVAILFGLVMVVWSGSRGGFFAWLAGISIWIIFLAHRSHSRRRWLMLTLGSIGGIALLLVWAAPFLDRISQTRMDLATDYPKLYIWRESCQLFLRFPWFGTGLGAFVTAFNHYKSEGGDTTFWHAENDYLQLLVETGYLGVLIFGGWLFLRLRPVVRWAWRERLAEPELVFGALAAFGAFLAHAAVEFVAQITANALLAAALLGFVVGQYDLGVERAPIVPPRPTRKQLIINWILAAMVLAAAGLQAYASFAWMAARRARAANQTHEIARHLSRSMKLWPWMSQRQIALTRAQVRLLNGEPWPNQITLAQTYRAQLNHTLAWDPLNWELRWERVWLDLAFSTNLQRTINEAWQVVRLNPRQAKIPLQLARHFASRDAELAGEFLRQADLSSAANLRQALELANQLRGPGSLLWALTPPTVQGLVTLGDFGVEQKLYPLAAQAYQRLTNRFDPLRLAEKFLAAQRPDLALALLPQPPQSPAAQLLSARAHCQAGNFPQAIRCAESFCLQSPFHRNFRAQTIPADASLGSGPDGPALQSKENALALAEQIWLKPASQRDQSLLRQLAGRFPEIPRLHWILYQTELELHDYPSAARTVVALAIQLGREE